MDFLEYKGYKGTVEYAQANDCLCGKVVGMGNILITYEGDTISELRSNFKANIEGYLGHCRGTNCKPKKPFSGTLNLRMPSEIHERVFLASMKMGITINDFINRAIVRELEAAESL